MKKILLAISALALASATTVNAGWFIVPFGAVWHSSGSGPKTNVTITVQHGDYQEVTKGKAPGDVKEILIEPNDNVGSDEEKPETPPPVPSESEWFDGIHSGPGAFRPPGKKTVAIIIDRRGDGVWLAGVDLPDRDRGRTTVRFDKYHKIEPGKVYRMEIAQKHGGDTAILFRVARSTAPASGTTAAGSITPAYVVQFAEVPPDTNER